MILQSLVRLADRENLMDDPDFEWRSVAWLVDIDESGKLLGVTSTLATPEGAKKPIPKQFRVPRSFGKRSGAGAMPEFLIDNCKYIFGFVGEKGANKIDRVRKLVDSSIELLEKTYAETSGDTGIAAQLACMKRLQDDPSELFSIWGTGEEDGQPVAHVSGVDQALFAPKEWTDSDVFAFRLKGEFIFARPAVEEYWRKLRSVEQGETAMCLVTGKQCVPIKKHLELKVFGASTAGAPLVSFNASAFESYGLKNNANAPIGREAAEKYGTALRRLLHRAWPTSDGGVLPKGNMLLPGGVTVLFWAESSDDTAMCMYPPLIDGDPDVVEALYQGVWKGKRIDIADPSLFHTLILSGAQGRIILREAITTTVGEVMANIKTYFGDLDVVKRHKDDSPYPSLYAVLSSLKPPGKAELPPAIAAGMYRSAVTPDPFPSNLLTMAMNRIRAHAGVSFNRVRIIKAVLNRNYDRNLEKTMDTGRTTAPYNLGRLLATLEKLQGDTIGAKAGIVDRFLTGACSMPGLVFPRLMTLHHHHLRKLPDGSKGYYNKLIDEIHANLPAPYPATLSLVDQGEFIVGYHHQRADLWKSKADRENEQAEAEA